MLGNTRVEGQEEFMELLYWDCALQELYKYHANLQTGKAGPFIPPIPFLLPVPKASSMSHTPLQDGVLAFGTGFQS